MSQITKPGTGGGGSGNVTGPGSSTDNAIVRWNGTSGTVIQNSVATLSDTGDIIANSIDLTVPISVADGGTNLSSYTSGDILYASGSSTLSKLPIGSSSQVLTVSGGVPTWSTPAASGVTSVSGTTNRITSTGGTTPVIDISASYVGQSSITTLGTVTSGVWNGTAIDATHGGTAQTSWTTGDIMYASAANTLSKLTAGLVGTQQIISDSGIPVWDKGSGGPDIFYFEEDFLYYNNSDFTGAYFLCSRNGVNNGFLSSAITGHPGIKVIRAVNSGDEFALNTFNGDQAAAYPTCFIGNGYLQVLTIINIPTLATVAEDYYFTCGLGAFGAYLGGSPGNNAVYFSYNRSSSTNWIAGTKSGGSFTSSSGSLPAVTTGWHTLMLEVNAAGTTATFTIDGVTIGTSSTNLPTSSSPLSLGYYLTKTNGTTERNIYVDYCKFYLKQTTSRF